MKLVNKSQEEWLKQGGSEAALSFIENVVGTLHQKAMNEGMLFKSEETESETKVTDEVETKSEDETEVVSEVVEETPEVEVEETEEVATEASNVDFGAVLTEVIFAAQKQYHTDVVEPLLARVKALTEELSNVKKEKSMGNIFTASDLLPAAAVAARIQKEFGTVKVEKTEAKVTVGGTVVKGDEGDDADSVTEAKVTSLTDANLFAEY